MERSVNIWPAMIAGACVGYYLWGAKGGFFGLLIFGAISGMLQLRDGD